GGRVSRKDSRSGYAGSVGGCRVHSAEERAAGAAAGSGERHGHAAYGIVQGIFYGGLQLRGERRAYGCVLWCGWRCGNACWYACTTGATGSLEGGKNCAPIAGGV